MILFLILFCVFIFWDFSFIENITHEVSTPLQEYCASLFKFESPHLQFYKALACGTPVKGFQYDILKYISLWHLVIVSAGHFKLILSLTSKVLPGRTYMNFINHIILIFFSLWTGAQPPVIKSYFDFLITQNSKKLKFWIPPVYSSLYACCITLLFFPTWNSSWSFVLSWLFTTLTILFENTSLWMKAVGIAIGSYPILYCFSPPHPLSFLFNIIFGPILSMILFPMSVILIFVPSLHQIMDPTIDGLIKFLTLLAGNPVLDSTSKFPSVSNLKISWVYLLFLQVWVILKKRTSK